jgi:hypothetical protein
MTMQDIGFVEATVKKMPCPGKSEIFLSPRNFDPALRVGHDGF